MGVVMRSIPLSISLTFWLKADGRGTDSRNVNVGSGPRREGWDGFLSGRHSPLHAITCKPRCRSSAASELL